MSGNRGTLGWFKNKTWRGLGKFEILDSQLTEVYDCAEASFQVIKKNLSELPPIFEPSLPFKKVSWLVQVNPLHMWCGSIPYLGDPWRGQHPHLVALLEELGRRISCSQITMRSWIHDWALLSYGVSIFLTKLCSILFLQTLKSRWETSFGLFSSIVFKSPCLYILFISVFSFHRLIGPETQNYVFWRCSTIINNMHHEVIINRWSLYEQSTLTWDINEMKFFLLETPFKFCFLITFIW